MTPPSDMADPFHVLVVDDEPLARQRLRRLVDVLERYQVVADAENSGQAIIAIEKYDPDIVLLDISMPGVSGMSCAQHITALADAPAVIFCTAYDQYALKAFDAKAAGYLVKPVEEERLLAALDHAVQLNKAQRRQVVYNDKPQPKNERQYVSVKSRRGIDLIPIESVLCFVADHKYVTVYHGEGESLIDDTLKELEAQYSPQFIRVHRNTLAAVEHMSGLVKNKEGHFELQLGQAHIQPLVSRRHVAVVKALLTSL